MNEICKNNYLELNLALNSILIHAKISEVINYLGNNNVLINLNLKWNPIIDKSKRIETRLCKYKNQR